MKNELILKATGGILPEAMTGIEGSVLVPSQPFDLRCDSKAGIFTIAGNGNEGSVLEFQIFDVREIKGIRPSEQYDKPADFAQLVGLATVSGKKVLSCLTFGGVSAQEAVAVIPMLRLKSEHLGALEFVVSIVLEPHTSKKKHKFYIAKFSYRKATADELQAAIDAIETNAAACFSFRDLPNIDSND